MREISKKRNFQRCKTCRRKSRFISQHGNCINCATEKVELARLQIKHKEGPVYEKYKEKVIRGLSK